MKGIENNAYASLKRLHKRTPLFGNDIIAWQLVQDQKHKLRDRCLEKLFNPIEVEYIQNHNRSILAFWELWAVKESAYKAWQRSYQAKTFFNPTSFECQKIEEHLYLVVQKGDLQEIEIKIEKTTEFIYASTVSEKYLISKVFNSKKKYQTFINQLNDEGWYLEKDQNNMPDLKNKTSQKTLPVSITHDHNWYAIQFEENEI
jgi:phosphopantetheinyl transferase (holo-ACP synthase)